MCEVRIRYSKSRIEYNKGMIDKICLETTQRKDVLQVEMPGMVRFVRFPPRSQSGVERSTNLASPWRSWCYLIWYTDRLTFVLEV